MGIAGWVIINVLEKQLFNVVEPKNMREDVHQSPACCVLQTPDYLPES